MYRGSFNRSASVGDFVKGSVRQIAFYPRRVRGKRYRPLRVGYVVRGLVLHTTYPTRFADNTRVAFPQNSVVLLKRRGLLKSKYLVGPLLRVINRRHYLNLFSEEL